MVPLGHETRPPPILPVCLSLLMLLAGCTDGGSGPDRLSTLIDNWEHPEVSSEYRYSTPDGSVTMRYLDLKSVPALSGDFHMWQVKEDETATRILLFDPATYVLRGEWQEHDSHATLKEWRWAPATELRQAPFVGLAAMTSGEIRTGATSLELESLINPLMIETQWLNRNYVENTTRSSNATYTAAFASASPLPTTLTGVVAGSMELTSVRSGPFPQEIPAFDGPQMQGLPFLLWNGGPFPETDGTSFVYSLSEAHTDLVDADQNYARFVEAPGARMCDAIYTRGGPTKDQTLTYTWKVEWCHTDGTKASIGITHQPLLLRTFVSYAYDESSGRPPHPFESMPRNLIPADMAYARILEAYPDDAYNFTYRVTASTFSRSELVFPSDPSVFRDAVEIEMLPSPGTRLPAHQFSAFDGIVLAHVYP